VAGQGGQGAPLIAYARLFPAGVKFAQASIGRVITKDAVRGTGLGHVLIREAIAAVADLWGVQPIRIGAQSRLTAYYSQHGFVEVGASYLEDNIDHQDMVWQPPST
jgi:ElaA protein